MSTMNYQRWMCGAGVALVTCFVLTGCHMSHEWQETTCTEPRTCLTGGETEGEPLGHTWAEATWIEATCAEPRHCSVCDETEGEPLQADFEKYGFECVELDTPYPYVTNCSESPDLTTAGTVTFTDYEVFSSDDTHPAVDGYEWRAVTVTFIFDDDNAYNYGISAYIATRDYYVNKYERFSE